MGPALNEISEYIEASGNDISNSHSIIKAMVDSLTQKGVSAGAKIDKI